MPTGQWAVSFGVNQGAGLGTSNPNWDLFIPDTDSNLAGLAFKPLSKIRKSK